MKLILFFLLTFSFQAIAQSEDCVFDLSTQTDEFVKNIEGVKNHTWNDEKKEAIILLENGDTLIAHRGGCNHFGISGALSIKDKSLDYIQLDLIIEKGLWIAKNLFNEIDFNELKDKIKKEDYEIGSDDEFLFIMYFNHNYYSNYHLRAEQLRNCVSIEIGYYYY